MILLWVDAAFLMSEPKMTMMIFRSGEWNGGSDYLECVEVRGYVPEGMQGGECAVLGGRGRGGGRWLGNE